MYIHLKYKLPSIIEKAFDFVDHSGTMLAVFKRKKGVTDGEIKALWQEMGLGDT